MNTCPHTNITQLPPEAARYAGAAQDTTTLYVCHECGRTVEDGPDGLTVFEPEARP